MQENFGESPASHDNNIPERPISPVLGTNKFNRHGISGRRVHLHNKIKTNSNSCRNQQRRAPDIAAEDESIEKRMNLIEQMKNERHCIYKLLTKPREEGARRNANDDIRFRKPTSIVSKNNVISGGLDKMHDTWCTEHNVECESTNNLNEVNYGVPLKSKSVSSDEDNRVLPSDLFSNNDSLSSNGFNSTITKKCNKIHSENDAVNSNDNRHFITVNIDGCSGISNLGNDCSCNLDNKQIVPSEVTTRNNRENVKNSQCHNALPHVTTVSSGNCLREGYSDDHRGTRNDFILNTQETEIYFENFTQNCSKVKQATKTSTNLENNSKNDEITDTSMRVLIDTVPSKNIIDLEFSPPNTVQRQDNIVYSNNVIELHRNQHFNGCSEESVVYSNISCKVSEDSVDVRKTLKSRKTKYDDKFLGFTINEQSYAEERFLKVKEKKDAMKTSVREGLDRVKKKHKHKKLKDTLETSDTNSKHDRNTSIQEEGEMNVVEQEEHPNNIDRHQHRLNRKHEKLKRKRNDHRDVLEMKRNKCTESGTRPREVTTPDGDQETAINDELKRQNRQDVDECVISKKLHRKHKRHVREKYGNDDSRQKSELDNNSTNSRDKVKETCQNESSVKQSVDADNLEITCTGMHSTENNSNTRDDLEEFKNDSIDTSVGDDVGAVENYTGVDHFESFPVPNTNRQKLKIEISCDNSVCININRNILNKDGTCRNFEYNGNKCAFNNVAGNCNNPTNSAKSIEFDDSKGQDQNVTGEHERPKVIHNLQPQKFDSVSDNQTTKSIFPVCLFKSASGNAIKLCAGSIEKFTKKLLDVVDLDNLEETKTCSEETKNKSENIKSNFPIKKYDDVAQISKKILHTQNVHSNFPSGVDSNGCGFKSASEKVIQLPKGTFRKAGKLFDDIYQLDELILIGETKANGGDVKCEDFDEINSNLVVTSRSYNKENNSNVCGSKIENLESSLDNETNKFSDDFQVKNSDDVGQERDFDIKNEPFLYSIRNDEFLEDFPMEQMNILDTEKQVENKCIREQNETQIEELSVGKHPQKIESGFKSASGKPIHLSERAVKNANGLYEDIQMEKLPIENPVYNTTNEFKSSTNKPIQSNELCNAIQREDQNSEISEHVISKDKEDVNELYKNQFCKISCGFKSARGKPIELSDIAMKKANELYKNIKEEEQFDINLPQKSNRNLSGNQIMKGGELTEHTKLSDRDVPKLEFEQSNRQGFQSSGGKSTSTSYGEISENENINNNKLSQQFELLNQDMCQKFELQQRNCQVFQSAGGKNISVSSKALNNIKSIFGDNEFHNTTSIKNITLPTLKNSNTTDPNKFIDMSCGDHKSQPLTSEEEAKNETSEKSVIKLNSIAKSSQSASAIELLHDVVETVDKALDTIKRKQATSTRRSLGMSKHKPVLISQEKLKQAEKLFANLDVEEGKKEYTYTAERNSVKSNHTVYHSTPIKNISVVPKETSNRNDLANIELTPVRNVTHCATTYNQEGLCIVMCDRTLGNIHTWQNDISKQIDKLKLQLDVLNEKHKELEVQKNYLTFSDENHRRLVIVTYFIIFYQLPNEIQIF